MGDTVNERGLFEKEYAVPVKKGIPNSIKKFVMRQIDGLDERDVGAWMDAALARDPSIREDAGKYMQLKQNECMRRALVSVDGKVVNQHGAPFMGMETWNKRTMGAVVSAYHELNGIDPDEVGKMLAAPGTTTDQPLTNAVSPEVTASA